MFKLFLFIFVIFFSSNTLHAECFSSFELRQSDFEIGARKTLKSENFSISKVSTDDDMLYEIETYSVDGNTKYTTEKSIKGLLPLFSVVHSLGMKTTFEYDDDIHLIIEKMDKLSIGSPAVYTAIEKKETNVGLKVNSTEITLEFLGCEKISENENSMFVKSYAVSYETKKANDEPVIIRYNYKFSPLLKWYIHKTLGNYSRYEVPLK